MERPLKFADGFIDDVAQVLKRLLQKQRRIDPQNPYAAALYVLGQQEATVIGRMVRVPKKAKAANTEKKAKSPIAHAEMNVICNAREKLYRSLKKPVEERKSFCLFVNTRPCPMCTAAIVNAQIFNVYFFFENGYRKDISEAIIRAKQADIAAKQKEEGNSGTRQQLRTFTFQELDSKWKDEFRRLSEKPRAKSPAK